LNIFSYLRVDCYNSLLLVVVSMFVAVKQNKILMIIVKKKEFNVKHVQLDT